MKSLKIYIYTLLLTFTAAIAASAATPSKPFTIVIDAGHGGKDVGAVDNNVKEKDINLGVALKLGDLIKKKMKDVEVVYTRDNDTYITLQGRADKANKAKGDLFLSIHTNSVDKNNKNRTTVSGASVYALGLHKDANNMAVARRENSVIELEKNYETKYSGFDPNSDESYIIFEMAQKKNLSQSIKFANAAQKQLVKTASRRDRGVHQAGFWVLWATSMPAVLVELDFICNPNSAVYMGSEQGQQNLADALFNAVKEYRETYKNVSKSAPASAFVETPNEDQGSLASESVELTTAPRQVKERKAVASTGGRDYAAARNRKRRSSAGREASETRDVSTENISLHSESEREGRAIASSSQKNAKDVEAKQVSEKEQKEAEKARKKAEKEKAKADRQAKQDKKTHRGKMERLTSVYKIQVLASAEKLKENNPRFCGLKPISMFKENNLYKYTYGETTSKAEIEQMLKEVRKKIPDAFLIQSISSK